MKYTRRLEFKKSSGGGYEWALPLTDIEGGYEWVSLPDVTERRYLEKVILDSIKIPPAIISYYKNLSRWTMWEALCLIKGISPPEDKNPERVFEDSPGKRRYQRMIERNVRPISTDRPDRFDPFVLLDCIKQAGLTIPPYFDFIKTAKASGETVYHWADDEQTGTDTEQVATNTSQSPVRIYPTPGTAWDQIQFRYVNDTHIEISYPGVETHAPYSMSNLGMDNKPMVSGLFRLFADNQGNINGKNTGPPDVKAHVSNLRKLLKQIFPDIVGAPIANHNRRTGYQCNFRISSAQ